MEQPIFLSYRRKDQPGYVARLADDLNGAFGDGVFRDVESVLAGENWQQVLRRKVSQAKVVIVVIGDQWESTLVTRRAASEPDYVHLELTTANDLGLPVIPVLLGGADMPDKKVLEDLAWLADIQLHQLSDTQERWTFDVDKLSNQIERITTLKRQNTHPKRSALSVALAAIAVFALLGWIVFKSNRGEIGESSDSPVTVIQQKQSGDNSTQIGTNTGTLTIDNSKSEQVEKREDKESAQ